MIAYNTSYKKQMKKKKIVSVIMLFILILNVSFPALGASEADNSHLSAEETELIYDTDNYEYEYTPGQIIVGMKKTDEKVRASADVFSGINVTSVKSLTGTKGLAVQSAGGENTLREILLVELASDTADGVLEAIEILKDHPQVAYAEPNYTVSAADLIPNDPEYSKLWGMPKIQAPAAWAASTGSRSVFVGVFDTGVAYNHPDLKNNVSTSLAVDYTGSSIGYNDIDGHGTHVAGTIGAEGNNSIGVAGVNWEVTIVPIKVLDDAGDGSWAAVIQGILYAKDKNIPIINMSLGSYGYIQSAKECIDAYPGLLVAGAGNDAKNNDTEKFYPASYECENIISVASTNSSDQLSGFSNYGAATVDIAAPGEYIYSTVPNDQYANYSGTSMATPHVTGAAALLKAINPGLTTAQLKSKILDNAEKVSGLGGKVATGGRLSIVLGDLNFDLVYDANNSTGKSVRYSIDDTSTILAVNDPAVDFAAEDGYKFAYWCTDSAGLGAGGERYDPGDTITLDGNVTLYAIWELKSGNENDPDYAKLTIKHVDKDGVKIANGQYDYTAKKVRGETFTLTAPTIAGYNFQSWMLNGVDQAGEIKIDSVEGDAEIVLVYALAQEDDFGNYDFTGTPNIQEVKAGETVTYTFRDFGNNWPHELADYSIMDVPDKGLDFVSAALPAFTNGSGISYDIVYITNLSDVQILHTGVSADNAFSFKAPILQNGEYIAVIALLFGTVPSGFAAGDEIQMDFRVWDNPPGATLTNNGILYYSANSKEFQFTTAGSVSTVTVSGSNPDKTSENSGQVKTGDDSNMFFWSVFLVISVVVIGVLLFIKRGSRAGGSED